MVQRAQAIPINIWDSFAGFGAELWWNNRVLLHGDEFTACVDISKADAALQQRRNRYTAFDDMLLHDSSDRYSVALQPPSSFSSYPQPTSSPSSILPATTLSCSTRSLRCENSVVRLFIRDLQAEHHNSTQQQGQHLVWPIAQSEDFDTERRGECGTGVVDVDERRHWWYYNHPMTCMRLTRSIRNQHRYCTANTTAAVAANAERIVLFHMVWFSGDWKRQATLAVSSFLVTQDLRQSRLILWLDRPLSAIAHTDTLLLILAAFPTLLQVRMYSMRDELIASQTALSSLLTGMPPSTTVAVGCAVI